MNWKEIEKSRKENKQKEEYEERKHSFERFLKRNKLEIENFTSNIPRRFKGRFEKKESKEFYRKFVISYEINASSYNLVVEIVNAEGNNWTNVKTKNYTSSFLYKCKNGRPGVSVDYFTTEEEVPGQNKVYTNCRIHGFSGEILKLVLAEFFRDSLSLEFSKPKEKPAPKTNKTQYSPPIKKEEELELDGKPPPKIRQHYNNKPKRSSYSGMKEKIRRVTRQPNDEPGKVKIIYTLNEDDKIYVMFKELERVFEIPVEKLIEECIKRQISIKEFTKLLTERKKEEW